MSWSTVQEAKQTAAGHGCTKGGHQDRYSHHKLSRCAPQQEATRAALNSASTVFPMGRTAQAAATNLHFHGWLMQLKGPSLPENILCRLTPVILRDSSPWMDLTDEGQCQHPQLHMECSHGECIPVHTHLATPRCPPRPGERLPQNAAKA